LSDEHHELFHQRFFPRFIEMVMKFPFRGLKQLGPLMDRLTITEAFLQQPLFHLSPDLKKKK